MSARRRALNALAGGALLMRLPQAHSAAVLAVRVWPARDYTRITLELNAPLQHSHQVLADPPRLVVDLRGVDLDGAMRDLVAKVKSDDPYIAAVRTGQYRPGVMRIVFDLREPVRPELLALEPIGPYRHRLVVDLYPIRDPLSLHAPDTLASLIERLDDPLESLIASRQLDRDLGRELDREVDRAQASARRFTIALDPGHGGEDPGAIGPEGTLEKDVVLAIARRVRVHLREHPGVQVLMTRDADYFVPLSVRVAKARSVQADLFVSIHADAFVQAQARGASVFVLSEHSASSMGARWLASRENRADLIGGIAPMQAHAEAAPVLIDLSRTAQISQSRRLGSTVLGELQQLGPLHKVKVEQAGFAVLRTPDMPSILVETAFISNPQEEQKLRDPLEQERIARALTRGILAYVRRLPPRSTV